MSLSLIKFYKTWLIVLCASSVVQPRSTPSIILGLNETNELLRPLNPVSIDEWLKIVNQQYHLLAYLTASTAWELSIQPNRFTTETGIKLTSLRSQWRNLRCDEAANLMEIFNLNDKAWHASDMFDKQSARMLYLLCRGPKFTTYQISELNKLLGQVFTINTETEICVPEELDICMDPRSLWDNTYIRTPTGSIYSMTLNGEELANSVPFIISNPFAYRCFKNEPDLEKIMTGDLSLFGELDCLLPKNIIYRWAWTSVRLATGPPIGILYNNAIAFMNIGAKNEGYMDMGEVWREELEIPNLKKQVNDLLYEVKPFYMLLHSVARKVLHDKYQTVPGFSRDGLIPADLLGHMWAQNWASLQSTLILPFTSFDLDKAIKNKNWSAKDMVRRAEDFYVSLGLDAMTDKFWQNSFFEKSKNVSKCHGSAADMFYENDYRMIVCAERSIDGFYTIVHEMGHIEYYMSYSNQPPLFREASNSAISEAIGDAIYLAMLVPQHLSRLGLVDDVELVTKTKTPFTNEYLCSIYCDEQTNLESNRLVSDPDIDVLGKKLQDLNKFNENLEEKLGNNSVPTNSFDTSLLLHLALSKIPNLPFGYIMDNVRWKMFSEGIKIEEVNDYFWQLLGREMGIKPPSRKNRSGLFDIGAKFHFADNTPFTRYFLAGFLQAQIFRGLCEMSLFGKVIGRKLPMPLHRCDIYGSKKAGKLLQKALSLGASAHWSEVLYLLTGQKEILPNALLEYYQPLIKWLEHVVLTYNLSYGWSYP